MDAGGAGPVCLTNPVSAIGRLLAGIIMIILMAGAKAQALLNQLALLQDADGRTCLRIGGCTFSTIDIYCKIVNGLVHAYITE